MSQVHTTESVSAAPSSLPSPASRSLRVTAIAPSCRSWSAAPVNAFSLWKPESVKVTKGADSIGTYHKTETQLPQVLQGLRRAPDERTTRRSG